ncbi:YdcF family protein [Thermodesulfovibrio sp. 3907-1M]|uniref:YdcF family protein n=1 Tax=Thermodesulfovibrio autotrophicus TaxID=3118333 RepID=A0AAU8GVY1_9BACT
MFFLKKFLTSMILPPGILILIFLFMAVLEKKKKFIRFLAILSALFVYLISIEPVKDLLLYPLEKNYTVTEKLNADAIVILGGGIYSLNSFTEDTSNRLLAGYRVYKKTRLPIIVSGSALEGKTPDSTAMAEMLKELGVESDKIIEESKSKDTAQNARYVSEICKEKNFKRVILITSAYHMERAVKLFKKTGLVILPYPADFKRSNHYNIYSFLPKFGNFSLSSKAIREYIALLVI